jgi:hypothetical protein
MAVPDDLAAQSGHRARSCRSLSFDDEASRFPSLSLKPVALASGKSIPACDGRTNFHIATGLRIIHFAGGAR